MQSLGCGGAAIGPVTHMTSGGRVYICCSPDRRVGVSTTARLLTDYRLLKGERVAGFDTDPHEPSYGVHFPGLVKAVNTADIRDQISLFDTLLGEDSAPKIVDVWSRAYGRFFETVREIGFFEEARDRKVMTILFYHANSTESALNGARELHRSWPEIRLVIVHNEGAAQLGAKARDILAHYPAGGKLVIPELHAPVNKTLEDASLSLANFLHAPPPSMSIVVRAALKAWLTPIVTQLNSFELRLAMESGLFSN
ncbi:MAG TPA: hypothetical protein VEH76_14185 [Methylocystis sp.]|nr:hypothetical protein [Methylocystis sp.]